MRADHGGSFSQATVTVPAHHLLASAIAGRRLFVGIAAESTPWTYMAGDTIFLAAPLQAQDNAADLGIVAQALLAGAGSLRPALLRRLIGRPAVARRYAWLEVRRAARLNEQLLPPSFARHTAFQSALTATGSADESLACAEARAPLGDVPGFVGTVQPVAALRARSLEQGGGSAPGNLRRPAEVEISNASEDSPQDQASETSRLLKLLENPLASQNPLANLLHDITGARRPGAAATAADRSAGGAGTEMPVGGVERAWRRGVQAIAARVTQARATLFQGPGRFTDSVTALYPEWDTHAGRMRPAWVHLSEVDAWRADGALDVTGLRAPPPVALLRRLSRLGLAYEMCRRQTEGTDLDTGSLAEHAVDLRLGQATPVPAIFRASRKTRRDLGVAIMLDLSASTGDRDAGGAPVFAHQLQAACQLAASFDRLGAKAALLGFHSRGRHTVHAVRLKSPEERWGAGVLERCAQLEPSFYTRTGAAIRHGAAILRTRIRLPNRLLILISDGFPFDQGYEGSYAEADTRKALAEARADGNAVVCLCVGGTTSRGKLRAVFGGANLLAVEDVAAVTLRITPVCRAALASVSHPKLPRAVPT